MTKDEALKDFEKFVKLKTTQRPAFADVVVDALKENSGHWCDSHKLPSAILFRNQIDLWEEQCSNCRRWSVRIEGLIPNNYCPHCGTKMEE